MSQGEAEKSNNMAWRTISDKSPAFRSFIKPNSRNGDSIHQSISALGSVISYNYPPNKL